MQKNDFSYFSLLFRRFVIENHPELQNNEQLISEKGHEASFLYSNCKRSGSNNVEAMEVALDMMYKGYQFSKFDLLTLVLEENEIKLNSKQVEELYYKLLPIFNKYDITDDFDNLPQCRTLYFEILGEIN